MSRMMLVVYLATLTLSLAAGDSSCDALNATDSACDVQPGGVHTSVLLQRSTMINKVLSTDRDASAPVTYQRGTYPCPGGSTALTSEHQCRAGASQLGLTWGYAGRFCGAPPGCSVAGCTGKVYWNTKSGSGWGKTICKTVHFTQPTGSCERCPVGKCDSSAGSCRVYPEGFFHCLLGAGEISPSEYTPWQWNGASYYNLPHTASCQTPATVTTAAPTDIEATLCWVRMPTGCSKGLSETTTPAEWFVDPHTVDSATCSTRLVAFNAHCSKDDAESQWTAEPAKACSYTVVTESLPNWATAAARCKLAMPRSKADVNAIVASTQDTGNIWIGLTCESGCQNKANWKFVDGSTPDASFPWEPNQPNSVGKQCAAIRGIEGGDNDVNDVACTFNGYMKQYACDKAPTPAPTEEPTPDPTEAATTTAALAPAPDLVVTDIEASKVEQICPAVLFTTKILCDDGTTVVEQGECCPDSKGCPTDCLGKNYTVDSSNENIMCQCEYCSGSREYKLQLSYEDAFLKAHNYFRCLHGHAMLGWDGAVAANADNAARQSCEAGTLTHSDSYHMTPEAGENLAKGQASPEEAATAWYNEIVDPGYTVGAWGSDAATAAHYTAAIWNASTTIGCSSCGSGEDKVWACQYAAEASNLGDQAAWEQNVPQSHVLAETPETCCAQMYGSAGAKGTPPGDAVSLMELVTGAHGTSGIPAEMLDMLDSHNMYRCMHNVPSMTWDSAIAENAQAWADAGHYGHSAQEDRTLPNIGYVGENLAWGYPTRSGSDSLKAWYDEVHFTDGTPDSCQDTTQAGKAVCHYTQVVWKSSTKLGCGKGKATVSGHDGDIWVCQYGPGGNMGGAFASEVFGPAKTAAECKSGAAAPVPEPAPTEEPTQDATCTDGAPEDDPIVKYSNGTLATCVSIDWACSDYGFVRAKCKKTCGSC